MVTLILKYEVVTLPEEEEICKTTRSRMAYEIASFNEKEQLDALEANKGA